MRVLALDLATRIGWASGDARSGDPVWGSYKLPSTGEEIGPFARCFDAFARDLIETHDPELIVFEAPMPTQAGATTLSTSLKLQGLCWHAEFLANCYEVQARQVAAASWKKAICGTGRVNKTMKPYPPAEACRKIGLQPGSSDEADALCIWLYAARLVAPREVSRFDPLARTGLAIA